MSRLLETLKLSEGKLYNLPYHQKRFNKARKALFPDEPELRLQTEIIIPESCKSGMYRCRVTYKKRIEKIEFFPHTYKTITSLQTIVCDEIDYTFKYEDRRMINSLVSKKKTSDDILIIKDSWVTDVSIGNIAFFDGSDWYTPAHSLLEGTKRQYLLESGVIKEKEINYTDIWSFEKARILNCFYDLETGADILVKDILPIK